MDESRATSSSEGASPADAAPSPRDSFHPSDRSLSIRPVTESIRLDYRLTQWSIRVFSRLWMRLEIEGGENIPATGPIMILSNHASFLDPLLIGSIISREIHYLARTGILEAPVVGWVTRRFNTHPIKRGAVNRAAIALSQAILRAGWPLLVFPEGTRTPDGRVKKPLGGFGMILDGLDRPACLPVYIDGSFRCLGRGKIFPRPTKIRIRFGPVFTIEPRGTDEPRRAYYDRCARRVEARWGALGAYGTPSMQESNPSG